MSCISYGTRSDRYRKTVDFVEGVSTSIRYRRRTLRVSLDEFVEPCLDLTLPLFQVEELAAESTGFLKIERRFQSG